VETSVDQFMKRVDACVQRLGREMAPISDEQRAVRLLEDETRSVERGCAAGVIAIEETNRIVTKDPWQGTAWIVEGTPAHLCWEYLPHMAAYAELLLDLEYPAAAVRFETPDDELRFDLAVVDEAGRVSVLGEAKTEPRMLDKLESLVGTFAADCGWPDRKSSAKEAQKLAHQLWVTRAPYLWLVASGARRAFRVEYNDRIALAPIDRLPAAEALWPAGFLGTTPRLATTRRD
jgi:hypothetical protein